MASVYVVVSKLEELFRGDISDCQEEARSLVSDGTKGIAILTETAYESRLANATVLAETPSALAELISASVGAVKTGTKVGDAIFRSTSRRVGRGNYSIDEYESALKGMCGSPRFMRVVDGNAVPRFDVLAKALNPELQQNPLTNGQIGWLIGEWARHQFNTDGIVPDGFVPANA